MKAVTISGSAWFGGLMGLATGLTGTAIADNILKVVTKTQTLHITDQLACGYRAFDLRVGYWPTKKNDASGRVRVSGRQVADCQAYELFMCHDSASLCGDVGLTRAEIPIFEKGTDEYLRLDRASAPPAGADISGVLETFYMFLKAHPTEFLFVSVQCAAKR